MLNFSTGSGRSMQDNPAVFDTEGIYIYQNIYKRATIIRITPTGCQHISST